MEDQNRLLENELDKFLISDNEIRNKLADRNRSPLKLDDLYRPNHSASLSQSLTNINARNIHEQSERELALLNLKKCETASQNSVRKSQRN